MVEMDQAVLEDKISRNQVAKSKRFRDRSSDRQSGPLDIGGHPRVLMRNMPPWHLDKIVGIRRYKNDISLTDREIETIVKWVDAGASERDPAHMPKRLSFASEDEWFIGKPDLLVTTNDFTMYPNGLD